MLSTSRRSGQHALEMHPRRWQCSGDELTKSAKISSTNCARGAKPHRATQDRNRCMKHCLTFTSHNLQFPPKFTTGIKLRILKLLPRIVSVLLLAAASKIGRASCRERV